MLQICKGPKMFLLLYVFQKVIFRGFKTKQRGKSTFFEKLDPIGRFRSGTCAVLIFELNLTNNVCLLYIKMTSQLVLKTRFCCETYFLVQFWHLLAGRYVDSKVDFLANSNKMMLLQSSNGFSFTQSKISISTSCPYKKCEHFQVAMWRCWCRWRVMEYRYLSRIILLFDFHHLLQFSDL